MAGKDGRAAARGLLTDKSRALFAEALTLLPGGVDSPVRAFKAVGGEPLFIDRGEGPLAVRRGRQPLHRLRAVLGSAGPRPRPPGGGGCARGGGGARYELRRAQPPGAGAGPAVQGLVPSVELIRFVNSGTEAVMSALRLARAFTGRQKIVKFIGGYHGHADMLLVQAGSGAATLGLPDSPGVPAAVTADTLSCAYNDLEGIRRIFKEHPGKIAAVIVEPVAGNMGVVLPQEGFLQGLRGTTRSDGALLVFDEVMTGFRVHPGGAQGRYGVAPDLTTLGKVIGGGLPVGAYGGRRDIMKLVAPAGPMYQAGTLSGNPLAMSAGIATLQELARPGGVGTAGSVDAGPGRRPGPGSARGGHSAADRAGRVDVRGIFLR